MGLNAARRRLGLNANRRRRKEVFDEVINVANVDNHVIGTEEHCHTVGEFFTLRNTVTHNVGERLCFWPRARKHDELFLKSAKILFTEGASPRKHVELVLKSAKILFLRLCLRLWLTFKWEAPTLTGARRHGHGCKSESALGPRRPDKTHLQLGTTLYIAVVNTHNLEAYRSTMTSKPSGTLPTGRRESRTIQIRMSICQRHNRVKFQSSNNVDLLTSQLCQFAVFEECRCVNVRMLSTFRVRRMSLYVAMSCARNTVDTNTLPR